MSHKQKNRGRISNSLRRLPSTYVVGITEKLSHNKTIFFFYKELVKMILIPRALDN